MKSASPGPSTSPAEVTNVTPHGFWLFIDDLLPQPSWPEGHAPKVPTLIEALERRSKFATVKLSWASGLMLVVRTGAA